MEAAAPSTERPVPLREAGGVEGVQSAELGRSSGSAAAAALADAQHEIDSRRQERRASTEAAHSSETGRAVRELNALLTAERRERIALLDEEVRAH